MGTQRSLTFKDLCFVLTDLVGFRIKGLPWWLRQERIHLRCRKCEFDPWVGKIPWRREWLPSPVFLPGEFHEQRGLAGHSPWVTKGQTQTHRRGDRVLGGGARTHPPTHTRAHTRAPCLPGGQRRAGGLAWRWDALSVVSRLSLAPQPHGLKVHQGPSRCSLPAPSASCSLEAIADGARFCGSHWRPAWLQYHGRP